MSDNKKFDQYDFASILAVIISLAALMTGIIETGIMKDQQEIMKDQMVMMDEQQKASVWPYLKTSISYSYADKITISGTIENKGVGPAITKKEELYIKGSSYSDYFSAYNKIDSLLGQSEIRFNFNIANKIDRVLSPGEKIEIFFLEFDRFSDDMSIVSKLDLKIESCYCSIYNDCWTKNGNPIEVPCEK